VTHKDGKVNDWVSLTFCRQILLVANGVVHCDDKVLLPLRIILTKKFKTGFGGPFFVKLFFQKAFNKIDETLAKGYSELIYFKKMSFFF